MQSLIISCCYTIGWFWSVMFGMNGYSLISLTGALFIISIQLYYIKIKDKYLYTQDLLLAVFSIPLGFFLETFFIQMGLLKYVKSANQIPPIWIICLYPLFSLLINHSLKIIKKSDLVSFAIGFFIAPLSYIAGASLGGVVFPYPIFLTYLAIGLCWGLFLCLLVKIARVLEKAAVEAYAESCSENTLKLLYDGECPLCKREIDFLQKKDQYKRIKFIDISSEQFSSCEQNNIDYETAMLQIHAIDANGKILVGIPVFAAVYARCQLLLIVTLMYIPLVAVILKPLYNLFAKNRLWLTGRCDSACKK